MEKNSPVNVFTEIPPQADMVFDQAIRRVFHHEGYYSNDPSDPGGATKYGISLRLAQSIGDLDGDGRLDLDFNGDGKVDARDIRLLTAEDAVDLYRRIFWQPYLYNKLTPAVAIKTFDLAVNMGHRQAHLILQRGIRACSAADAVKEDGVLGPATLRAANRQLSPSLVAAMRSEAAGFYRLLVNNRRASRKYLNGWLNRAYA